MDRKVPFLKGAFTPLVAPFKRGEVDYDRYAALIEWQIEQVGCSEDNMRSCHWTSARHIAACLAAATSIAALIASRTIRCLRGTFAYLMLTAVVALGADLATAGAPAPSGHAVMAWHVTIPPSWFDPSTAPPQITPFGMLYAIHDALVRPYPGYKMGPSLAESWEESEDGLYYEFKLRPGLKFHNGDPLPAEDVKFSFERYKGAAASILHDRVVGVEIVDPRVVRFHLKSPWSDFMTFYGTTASAAGIIVPKNYLTQVGDDGFKKHPIGAGPYKFVSQKPGVEIDLEADPGYWRRVPNVKTLVMKSVPEATTRAGQPTESSQLGRATSTL